jgi:hypothetical protein
MATVTASYNWVSGETVTPAKLNTTAAPTVVVADNEVTTAKILDANVTNAKLASDIDASKLTTGTLPADRIGADAITTARILNANVTPAKLSQPLTLETAKAATSGTSIDFTGIPSWVKRITVMWNGVSGSGTSAFLIQLGDAGGIENTGYSSYVTFAASTVSTSDYTAGFAIGGGIAARSYRGLLQICLLGSNAWVASGTGNDATANNTFLSGSKTLSDTLDRIRLTTVNGTDTFDAGSVNIMYEG